MRFVRGVGYIDDTKNIAQINTVNATNKSVNKTNFDSILTTETKKLSGINQTYTLDDIFTEASNKYGVSKDLLVAVAYNESGFRADATSSAGAMGIMQLMPSTAESLGVSNPYDAYENIMGGAKLLSGLVEKYNGDYSLALAAYNAGSGNVAKYGGIPPFKETQNYVAKVLATMQSTAAIPNESYQVGTVLPNLDPTVNAYETTNYNTSNIDAKKALQIAQTIISNTLLSRTNQTTASAMPFDANDEYSSSLAGLVLSSIGGNTSIRELNLDTLISAIEKSLSSNDLDTLYSYADYTLLNNYYDNMLDIISDIGSSGIKDDENSNNNSLMDLYRLSAQNKVGTATRLSL